MSSHTRFKLYAERNTGSRYLARLVEHNLACRLLPGTVPSRVRRLQALVPGKNRVRDLYFERTYAENLGWKHSQADIERMLALGPALDGIHFLLLFKNPYSWLLSMTKRPYHRQGSGPLEAQDLESFLTAPWTTVGRENGPPVYRDVVDLWNRKNRSYLAVAERFPATPLNYERLLADPAAAMDTIRRDSNCEWRSASFENLSESTKERGKDSAFYRDYYLNERWKEYLTPVQIELTNQRLDHGLVERLGYRIL